MQWSNEPHGGFTKNAKPHTPVIDKGPYGYQHINAAIQRRHADTMLNWTERIIRMGKEVPEIGWGDFTALNVRDPAVLALRYDWRNNSVLFLHIFTNNRVKFSWIRAWIGQRASCWLIFLLRITVGRTNPANTALYWKATVTVVPGRRTRLSAASDRHRSP
jgi:maltose alpha-D-glucosyltransferase / alpha-amylase